MLFLETNYWHLGTASQISGHEQHMFPGKNRVIRGRLIAGGFMTGGFMTGELMTVGLRTGELVMGGHMTRWLKIYY